MSGAVNKRDDIILSFFKFMLAAAAVVVFLYPLFLTVVVSLKTKPEVFARFFGLPASPQFSNYADAWKRGHIGQAFLNSMIICSSTVVLQIFAAGMAAFILSRVKFRINSLLYVFITMGMMIPLHAVVLPIAKRAVSWGMSDSRLYLVLVYTGGGIPWLVFLMVSFMKSIPDSIEEAAVMDGCTLRQIYFRITIFLSQPIFITSAIITFLGSYNELLLAMVLLKSRAKKTIPVALSAFTGFHDVNYPQLTAAVVISILPAVILYVLFQENIKRGLTAGSVKE